jgi:5-methylcytosine-specific restriction protein A
VPVRPASHRQPGTLTRADREKARKAAQDVTRASQHARGYDAEWRKLRADYLKANPRCSHPGCQDAAREVDHIQSVASRPDLRLAWSNIRGLCKRHHSQRTAKEQGFAVGALARPDWLKPSLVPLTIVCGPVAAGKTTWVRAHAAPGDLVLDLDQIAAEMAGSSPRGWDAKWIGPALRARNDVLGSLSRPGSGWRRAWLILSEPDRDRRQWWHDALKPQRIVVLETQPATCMERVRLDPDRAVRRESQYQAISGWWGRYSRRDGDEIVK